MSIIRNFLIESKESRRSDAILSTLRGAGAGVIAGKIHSNITNYTTAKNTNRKYNDALKLSKLRKVFPNATSDELAKKLYGEKDYKKWAKNKHKFVSKRYRQYTPPNELKRKLAGAAIGAGIGLGTQQLSMRRFEKKAKEGCMKRYKSDYNKFVECVYTKYKMSPREDSPERSSLRKYYLNNGGKRTQKKQKLNNK